MLADVLRSLHGVGTIRRSAKAYNQAFRADTRMCYSDCPMCLFDGASVLLCRVRALYKGFVPKVLRLGPGGGVLLVVFEAVSSWMKGFL